MAAPGPTEVYEVATFYHHFQVVKEGEGPPPALTLRLCDSLPCAMAGAEALIDTLQATLGPEVRVQRVSCVGRCDRAPVAVLGARPIEAATTQRIRAAVRERAIDTPLPAGALDYDAYRAGGGYERPGALGSNPDEAACEAVIGTLEQSGLRGLGGAGFLAGRKWRIVRGQPAPRLMAVNLDEGEPGTFKDRCLLERDPHRFLEGALIAAKVVAAEAIYLYVRDEYAGYRALLARELDRLYADPPRRPAADLHASGGWGLYLR
jgi:formate dehydrogenase